MARRQAGKNPLPERQPLLGAGAINKKVLRPGAFAVSSGDQFRMPFCGLLFSLVLEDEAEREVPVRPQTSNRVAELCANLQLGLLSGQQPG